MKIIIFKFYFIKRKFMNHLIKTSFTKIMISNYIFNEVCDSLDPLDIVFIKVFNSHSSNIRYFFLIFQTLLL